MVGLSYDICKGLVSKHKANKFQTHIVTKVVKKLEKNIVNLLDPENSMESRFKKIDCKLPKELAELQGQLTQSDQ